MGKHIVIPAQAWDADINMHELKFYMHLLKIANEKGGVVVKNLELSRALNYDQQKIHRCLSTLVKVGLVKVEIVNHYHRTIYPQYFPDETPRNLGDL